MVEHVGEQLQVARSDEESDGAIAPSYRWLETGLDLLTEVPAALLLLIEIVVLSAAVISRYIFNRPIVWSDELSITLFLWLAMLGSVIAVRRSQHMRLTFVIARLPTTWRARVDTATMIVIIAFLLQILLPAIRYTKERASIISEGLHIPLSVISAAVAVGVALMALVLAVRLFERSSWRDIGISLIGIVIVASGLWLVTPQLEAIGNYNLIVFFIVLVVIFVLMGMPIAFAFGVATFSYLSLLTEIPLTIVVNRMCEGMSDIILLSIPLFIFLGYLMGLAGLARPLIEFLFAIIGHVRNGLSYVLLVGMYLVSGISGSKAADMAAIVPILVPEMKRRGVKDGEIVSLLAASGAMAETIPPSIILISIGVVTGVSIANLFTGGLMPAAVGAVALGLVIFVRSRRRSAPERARAKLPEIFRATIIALPALVLPLIIRGAVINGIATATEVATVGISYGTFCGIFVYRQFLWRRLYEALVSTASLAGCILLIIGMATAMSWALTQSGFSSELVDAMTAVPGGRVTFMVMSIALFAVLGSVLEGFPAIVLFGPLMFPIARDLGINEVHYTMVVVLAMSLGLFSPPLGIGYYSACAIAEISPDKAMGGIWVYMAALIVAVAIVAAVPWLSTGFL